MTLEEAQQEMLDLEDDVVNQGGLESHRRLRELEEAIERHHAESEFATISVEDRQPDGTWALTETVKLPSPRREVDADEDDIPMWAQAGMTPERIDEEMREMLDRENEGIHRAEMERSLATEEGPPDELEPAPQGSEPENFPDWDDQMAAKAGDADRFSMSRNFLATDKVPDAIFGIPVVSRDEDYTPEDLAFFHEHPEAGGYYDMGGETPEDGTEEGAPMQADEAGVPAPPPAPAPAPTAWDRAERDAERRRQTILEGRIEPGVHEARLMSPAELRRASEARREVLRQAFQAYGWRTGRRTMDAKGGRTIHAGLGAGKPTRGRYPGIANNPGNVEKHERRTDKTLFKGEVGNGVRPKRFANFSDPVSGLDAAAAVLARRANELEAKGLPFAIENYVPNYAPASENDVEGYIKNISKYSGIARNAAMDRWNIDDMAKLLRTVVRFESGYPHSKWFTDDEYKAAAGLLAEGAAD